MLNCATLSDVGLVYGSFRFFQNEIDEINSSLIHVIILIPEIPYLQCKELALQTMWNFLSKYFIRINKDRSVI